MIQIVTKSTKTSCVKFFFEEGKTLMQLPEEIRSLFGGERLKSLWIPSRDGYRTLCIGMGKPDTGIIHIKEICAKAVKEMKEKEIGEFSMDVSDILDNNGMESLRDIVEGAVLGGYEQRQFKEKKEIVQEIELTGVSEYESGRAKELLQEAYTVAEGVCFARDMVNLPGNKLRPEDFAREIIEFVSDTDIQAEVFDSQKLKEMNMTALLGVGESSQYPPCLLVLRHLGAGKEKKTTALVGKGVTCDTGGYCLKPAGSMLGIKGDMAGGAAVAGAIYALAKNKVKTNVVAVIPMCENRISSGSLLPGDVIGSFAGKTIEIANTDAEGRLILADAVSYAVQREHADRVLDIATLTGAVVNMLGFSIGGVIADNDDFFGDFREAYRLSGEQYWRLPAYPEHEKMIESKIADIRNLGESCCGTITAGLFIRAFAEEKPWLHLDIAGTAWVDKPVFGFQSQGATGAGVTTIYQLCSRED